MMFLSNWLNEYGDLGIMSVSSEYLSGRSVYISEESRINHALNHGGVAVVRLYLDEEHYVLMTGVENENILLFDPYYEEIDDPELDDEYKTEEIEFLHHMPKRANRSISVCRLNRTALDYYQMGEFSNREALIMYRTSLEYPKHIADLPASGKTL